MRAGYEPRQSIDEALPARTELAHDDGQAAGGDVDAEAAARPQRVPVRPAVAQRAPAQPRQRTPAPRRPVAAAGRRRDPGRRAQRVEQGPRGVDRAGEIVGEPAVDGVKWIRAERLTQRTEAGGVRPVGGGVGGDGDAEHVTTHDEREQLVEEPTTANESVPKIMLNDTINSSLTAIGILVISNHNRFRVLFDKIASVYFI